MLSPLSVIGVCVVYRGSVSDAALGNVREDVAKLTQRLEHMAQSLEYDMAKVGA